MVFERLQVRCLSSTYQWELGKNKAFAICCYIDSFINSDGGKSKTSSDARCKVCFKKLALNEYFKVCCTCKQKVCDDCSASYGPKEAMAVEVTSYLKSSSSSIVIYYYQATFKCSICLRQIKHISEDGNRRVGLYNLKSAGMAVVAQNRFKSSGMSASKRQDSFHFEGKQAVLSLPEQQVRRHSIGNVPGMSINIAALQPKMEKKVCKRLIMLPLNYL